MTTPDQPYLERLNNISFQPVFIMGDHRSGTTLLYQLLGLSNCFNPVTAYHLTQYPELLANHIQNRTTEAKQQLQRRFDTLGLTDRKIDGVQVSPDLTEEYGFLFHGSGQRPQINPQTVGLFTELCQKIQFISENSRPILLKNPWDYFRNFVYVKEQFPHAKFVFLSRHPTRTVNSQIKATRSLFQEKNLYVALIADWYEALFNNPIRLYLTRLAFSNLFDLGYRLSKLHVVRATDYLMENLPQMPASDYVTIRYEDMCQFPNQTISKILSFLQITPPTPINYETFINERQSPLLPEVEKHKADLANALKPYYDYYNYDIQGTSL